MNRIKLPVALLAVAGLVVACSDGVGPDGLGLDGPAFSTAPGTSVGGVEPTLKKGTITQGANYCDLLAPAGETWISGAKVEGPYDATQDGFEFIISDDKKYLEWEGNDNQMRAVIVKGGPASYVYFYTDQTSDSGLHSPEHAGGIPDISHYGYCYQAEENGSIEETLRVIKFYDANANGVFDDGEEELIGWLFYSAYHDDDFYTPAAWDLEDGSYTFTEYLPNEEGWVSTTGTQLTAEVPDDQIVAFGNVCLGYGGGNTLGFWSNRNGRELLSDFDPGWRGELNGYSLVDANGDAFQIAEDGDFYEVTGQGRNAVETGAYPPFRQWLLSADATNMSYMLSVQLAAMVLNVLTGEVDEDAIVWAPGFDGEDLADGFITIAELLVLAEDFLADGNQIVDSDHPFREYAEALKDALDNANNNMSFVQATPCAFTFGEPEE